MRSWYEEQSGENISTSEFWQLCQARDHYRQKYAEYWRHMDSQTRSGRRVDGIIQAVAPCVAGRQNDHLYYAYSAIANVLDLPATVFPVTSGFSQSELACEEKLNCSALNEEDNLVQGCCECAKSCEKNYVKTDSCRSRIRRAEYASGAPSAG